MPIVHTDKFHTEVVGKDRRKTETRGKMENKNIKE